MGPRTTRAGSLLARQVSSTERWNCNLGKHVVAYLEAFDKWNAEELAVLQGNLAKLARKMWLAPTQ